MIAATDELSDTRSRHLGVLLGQVHRYLTHLYVIALATLTEHILLRYAIVIANLLKNIIYSERMVVNLDCTLDDTLGQLHIEIRIVHDRVSHQRVDYTLKVAHATIGGLSDKLADIAGNAESVAATLGIQDVNTQLYVGFLQFGYQSARETCEQTILNTLQVYRRTVAGQNYLFTQAEQVVENVEEGIESLWRIYPLLDIVYDEYVDVLIEVDKVVSGVLTYRIGELHLEQTGADVEHTLVGIRLAALQSDGIYQVGLTTTRWTIDEEWIEGGLTRMLSDRQSYSAGQLVRSTLDVVVEALLRVELRIELLLAWGIEHAGRLVDVLTNRYSFQTAWTFTLIYSGNIATMTFVGLDLNDSVVKLNTCSKHSREYLT